MFSKRAVFLKILNFLSADLCLKESGDLYPLIKIKTQSGFSYSHAVLLNQPHTPQRCSLWISACLRVQLLTCNRSKQGSMGQKNDSCWLQRGLDRITTSDPNLRPLLARSPHVTGNVWFIYLCPSQPLVHLINHQSSRHNNSNTPRGLIDLLLTPRQGHCPPTVPLPWWR